MSSFARELGMDIDVDSDYTLSIHPQEDVECLGFGCSSFVYAVNTHIVLKSTYSYVKPSEDADQYYYALESVCQYQDIQSERDILRRLDPFPHPNIVQVIALDHPEGIYLRRYSPLSKRLSAEKPAVLIRLAWYRDMLRALTHLHQFEIAHADIQVENFLLDSQDTVVLCDFACSRSFGQRNPSGNINPTDRSVNGFSQVVSGTTDLFAVASVIFEIETGASPVFFNPNNVLHAPAGNTGDERLDLILYNAWYGKYGMTAEMLGDIEPLLGTYQAASHSLLGPAAIESLHTELDTWRNVRKQKFGKFPPT